MKLIYVASPYAGDIKKNMEYAKQACRAVMESGHAFFAPHLLYPAVLNDAVQEERQAGMDMGLTMLFRCDALEEHPAAARTAEPAAQEAAQPLLQ